MSKYFNPSHQEAELVGRWVMSAGKVVADDVCRRVDFLINEGFVRIEATIGDAPNSVHLEKIWQTYALQLI